MSYSQTIANWELPGITFKRVASTNGGEYVSPCPDCGGDDRFHVWPNEGETGRYWCRQCGKKGDLIDFLCWQKGKSFKEACEAVGKTPPQRRKVFTDTSSFKKSKTPEGVQFTQHKRRISTDLSWLKPAPPKEYQFKPQPKEAERLNQQTDEAIKLIEKPILEEEKQTVTLETEPTSKPLPSPGLFSEQCKTCAKFDIDYGIAWCFNGNSYRNHQHLSSCNDYEIPNC